MERPFKIALVGSSNTGKSSIASSFVSGKFDDVNDTTLGVSFYAYTLGGYKLQLWDTAGQERFRSLVPMYIRGSDMIIAVYKATNNSTYDELIDIWIPYIKKIDSNIPICIVESMIDDINSESSKLTEEAKKYAEFNGYLFWRVSSKEQTNITEMFTNIVNKLKTGRLSSLNSLNIESTIQSGYCCF